MEQIQEVIIEETPVIESVIEETPVVKPKKIYNKKPKNPEYFNEYYHKNKDDIVECQFCHTFVCRLRMCKHVKSQKCRLAQCQPHEEKKEQELTHAKKKQIETKQELTNTRMKHLITMEEKMFKVLDKYFDALSQK